MDFACLVFSSHVNFVKYCNLLHIYSKKNYFFLIQITVPEENVATVKHGATVILGEAKQALLDGDTANYDMERGIY